MTLTLQENANGAITGVGTYAGEPVRVTGVRAGHFVTLHVLQVGTDIPISLDGRLTGNAIELDQGPGLTRRD